MQMILIAQTVLLVAIFVLVAWTQPWQKSSGSANSRTLNANGSATVKAEPDSFDFYPYFESTGDDQQALRDSQTEEMNRIIDGLKQIGVDDKEMQLDSNAYDNWYVREDGTTVATVNLRISVEDENLAEKVQNYLTTTDAKGQVTPQSNFSEEKRRSLQDDALKDAITDARERAEAKADLLSVRLGDVVSVDESYGGGFFALDDSVTLEARSEPASVEQQSLPFLPGTNEVTVTVSVVYEIK